MKLIEKQTQNKNLNRRRKKVTLQPARLVTEEETTRNSWK